MKETHTKKYKEDVEKALRAVATGKAYHWETIATILGEEVLRLRHLLEPAPLPKEDAVIKWFCNTCGLYHELGVYCPKCGKEMSNGIQSKEKKKRRTRRIKIKSP